MPRSFRIRTARIEDAPTLVALGARRFADAHRDGFAPDDLQVVVERDWNEPQVANEIADPDVRFFVGVSPEASDDHPVGLCALRPGSIHGTDETAMELGRLYLEPDYLGTGLGSALVDAVLEACDGAGHDRCWLIVWDHNDRATALYERRGFEVVGEFPYAIGNSAPTAVLMIRPRPTP